MVIVAVALVERSAACNACFFMMGIQMGLHRDQEGSRLAFDFWFRIRICIRHARRSTDSFLRLVCFSASVTQGVTDAPCPRHPSRHTHTYTQTDRHRWRRILDISGRVHSRVSRRS